MAEIDYKNYGRIRVTFYPESSMPPWQGENWLISGFDDIDTSVIRTWVEDINSMGEDTILQFCGTRMVFVKKQETVIEAILLFA